MTGQQGCTAGNKSTPFTGGDMYYLQSFFKEESLTDLCSHHQKITQLTSLLRGSKTPARQTGLTLGWWRPPLEDRAAPAQKILRLHSTEPCPEGVRSLTLAAETLAG